MPARVSASSLVWLPGILVLLCGAASAREAPPPAEARVHDHVAFVFTASDGSRTPAQRAAEASLSLARVVDEGIPGGVYLQLRGTSLAQVKLGDRELFRLVPADAVAAGAPGLVEYAPQVQAQLSDFLTTERRRARLQHGVLRASLVVFFAVLIWLLLRLVLRGLALLELRLRKDSELLPTQLRHLARGPWRSLAQLSLAIARLATWLAAGIIFLLSSLSLFDSTRPWGSRLASGVAEPFTGLLTRLGGALPKLLLLLLLAAVVRGGWQAISQALDRAARAPAAEGGLAHERVRPYRLVARAGLVLGALLVVPFVLGGESSLFTAVGLVGMGAVALAFVPLASAVVVGAWALFTREYRLGEWLRVRLPGGREVIGEVVAIEFTHLRIVPETGGDVRVPHLALLFTMVVHLPEDRFLAVEVPVDRSALSPAAALQRLEAAARKVAVAHNLMAPPRLRVLEVTAETARFSVAIAGAPESLRNGLLLALVEATSNPVSRPPGGSKVPTGDSPKHKSRAASEPSEQGERAMASEPFERDERAMASEAPEQEEGAPASDDAAQASSAGDPSAESAQ